MSTAPSSLSLNESVSFIQKKNESVSTPVGSKPNLSPGSSPSHLDAATSDQATENKTSPPPSTNATSPPPPPLSSPPPPSSPPPSPPPSSPPPSLSSPPPSQQLILNSPSNPQNSQPTPLPESPQPKSLTISPPPTPSNPSPVPDQKESPPSPVQSSPSIPYNSLISPPAGGIFVAPPLSVGSQPPPSPPGQLAGPLSLPNANVQPATPDPNGNPPMGPLGKESTVPSPPISGGAPSGRLSPNSPGSNNTPSSSHGNRNGFPSSGAVIGGAVVGVLVFALIAILFIRRRKGQKKAYNSHYIPSKNLTVKTDGYRYREQQQPVGFTGPASHSLHSSGDGYGSHSEGGVDSDAIGNSKTFYSYKELMEMTNGFAHQNILGEGGFGCVYKGWMPDGKAVAVKQLKAGGGQGNREFKTEIEIISRVHHRHLVSLEGYCISENQRSLIYEFVPNKTLDHHLHEKGLPVLDWPKRLKIAIGSAKGLAYLHEDCHPKIIHRDIKSANILLDDAFEAKVADFGLARLNDTTRTHVSTRVMGTFGYLAPEYASSGKLTDKSDVFSFGVVLLELITGRKPVDPSQPLGDESLVEWARPVLINALETEDLSELVDPRLGKHYVEAEMLRMIKIAAACVRHSALNRPCMVQVVRALDSYTELSDLTNGVRYGQSTAYDSAQYNQQIERFRRTALGINDSLEFNTFSGESVARDASHRPFSSDYTSGESETRAMNPPGNYRFT